METNYFKSVNKKIFYSLFLVSMLIGNSFDMMAQVKVPFKQRTSNATPTKKIYSVKGDFSMMGNTNLTLVTYGDDRDNSNRDMKYVDVDNDASTWNSSSSNLTFSNENGAIPSCSNIVYAGLYWTGRSSDGADSPNVFTATKYVPGIQTINNNLDIRHGNAVENTNYTMTISRGGNENNRYPIYTFTNGSSSYVFRFTKNNNTDAVSVSKNNGNYINVPVSVYTDNYGRRIADFNSPYEIENGDVTIKINSLRKITTESGSTSDYQDSPNRANVNVVGTINGVVPVTKTYDKRKVSLKGPSATNYTTITANTNDIYYPTSGDGFMFSGYAEVTDYVRQNGIGQYTVADIALVEGNGTTTGFYGGWSLVVVYENSKMKYRDVTVFDGHAYVAGNVTAEFELPISGFNAIQNGPVNMKLGVMAGEGDKNISGDYFQIQKNSDNSWMNLSHDNNSGNNFFNSSIYTGGNTRTPNFVNNTGLDISVFNIPNANNSVIANGQTATKFKYGSTQDTYVIFATVMSVDAYVPEIEGILTTTAVNGVAVSNQNPTALPGQEISYNVNIKNLGTEAINNANVIIPIPFNASYVNESATKTTFFNPAPTPNNVTFNPNLGPNGSIVWNIGTLPLPANPNTLLGTLKFRLKTTTDCSILANSSCSDGILVYGSTTGVGAITGIQVKDQPLIRGYQENGSCVGEPIAVPLTVNVNATNYLAQNCGTTTAVKNFPFCNLTETTIPVSQVAGSFPNGSNFYNEYPVTQNSIQYSASNPFPATAGTSITYYAVPQNAGSCVFSFKISVCNPIDAVNDNMPSTLGVLGNSNVGNIFANNSNGADMLNGSQVAFGLVNLTVTNPATPLLPLPGTAVPYINLSTGNVVVPVGTLPGNYTITYQICEKANPTNCDTAIVNVPVSITPIDAVNDLIPSTVGAVGASNAGNIFADNGSGIDKLNGLLVNIGLINLSVSNAATPIFPGAPVPTINLLNGNVVIPEKTPAGNYQIKYRICENLNSSNCDEAFVTIPVTAAPIDAVNDTIASTVGAIGNTNAGNVLGNDTLNGNTVVLDKVNLTVTTAATPINGGSVPTIDANGNVVIPAGTPAGNYTITYKICEKLNPNNCDSAVVTIPVTASVIDAKHDIMLPVNGYIGTSNAGNIFANNGGGIDTLNDNQVLLSQVNLTIITPATSINNQPIPYIDFTTGLVIVPAGTPGDIYTITYQICEKLNPTNCDTAIVKVAVFATKIDAVNDTIAPVNGLSGNTNAGNVLGNDTLNGNDVALAQVNLAVTTAATPINGGSIPTIDANGNVVIPAGTPAGNYTITYQICEKLNPTNCDTAVVTIPVTASPIVANDDTIAPVNGLSGNTNAGNVFADNGNGTDKLNGNDVALAQVNLAVTTAATPINGGSIPTIDANGNVVIPAGTPAGNYTITYQICEKLNPTNCDTAVVTIPVTASPIVANDDTIAPVNGLSGNTNAGNVFADNGNGTDKLNGNDVALAQVNLAVTTAATPINGGSIPTIDANGNVVIPAGTPAGNYTITYQICEKLNPTNCDTAVVTIPVTASPIVANDDTVAPVNGLSGNTNAGNVFADNGNGTDKLNGNDVTLAQVNLAVTTAATPINGGSVPTIDANGNVVIPAGTPAGNYTITYQICEKLNPTNCDTAVVTVPVTASPIVANDDTIAPVNGLSGNTNAGNVFADNGNGTDKLNGNDVTLAQVNLTVTTAATPINGGSVPTIDANGNVVIPAGTPAGNYTITYQICEKLNPTNCDTAVVTIPVTASAIVANDDTIAPVNGLSGNTNAGNVLGNDTLNGNDVTLAQVNLTVTTAATPINGGSIPTIDANGNVVIPAGTPAGNYTITYQICEKLNPTNCDTAVVTIPVTASAIVANDDTVAPVNGLSGNTNAGNVFADNGNGTDKLNGNDVTLAQVNLTVTTAATPINGGSIPTIDANGNVVIPAGTPAGNYTITYQICEKLNPTNCDTAVVTIPVTASAIVANDDTVAPVNGLSGNTNAGNVFADNGNGTDKLNGNDVTLAQLNLAVTTPATPINGGSIPTIDANGNVVIPAGTPAGNYTITYQICEKLNPTNCDTAVVTIPVTASAIVANDDTIAPVNGLSGNTNAGNVFADNGNGTDKLNGNDVTLAQVNLAVTTPATPINGGSVPTIDANGNVVIPAGTPAGNYTITYQICEKLNPTNCDTAVVTIPVTASAIVANDDTIAPVNGLSGNTNAGNVFADNGNGTDKLNGNDVTLAQVNLAVTTPATPINGGSVPTIDANGNVVIPAGTPAGNYTITYQICEKLNPTNCDTAVVTIPVTASAIVANDDTVAPVNGLSGNTNAGNVFADNGNGTDKLNGNDVTLAQVNLTVTTAATPINGGSVPTIDANGNVVIPAGTPAGNYTITYQICEKLNPTNCDTAVVTIPVTASAIVANDDTIASTVGAIGNTNAGNVFADNGNGTDKLNGNDVTLSQVNLTVTAAATPINGGSIPTIDANGNVVIPAGTPAGNYTITYQICEKLNPTNCDTAVVTIPVTASAIVANDDTIASTVGAIGNTNAGNVFADNGNGTDKLNGNDVTLAQVNLTVTTAATPINGGSIPTIDANGNVVIPAGTPAGNYTITYQICEKLNPTNCDTAVVTIPVTASAIVANDDTIAPVNGLSGNTNAGNVFADNGNGTDKLNGNDVTLAQVNLTVTTAATPINGGSVPTIDANGNVVIPAGTPAGNYTITYQICEKLNPTNCDTAVVTIPVTASAIVANDDTIAPINGLSGNTNAGNVFADNGNGTDKLNGNDVTLAQVNLTVTTAATPINGGSVPTIDANGNVVIPAGTPAGNYTITYQICEKLNPTNCDTAVVTIPVYVPSIELLKEGTYLDTSLPTGVSVGDVINYTFTVTNTGNATLTDIIVTDPLVTVIGGPLASLSAGASDSTTFTAVYTITQADIDAGQVNNLATATATPPSGNPITDTSSDPTPCITCEPVVGCPDCTSTELPGNPSINVTKDGTYVDVNSDGITNVGDTVVYAFTVTNTGNVTLTNVTLSDNNAVISGGPITTLVVGASDSTTFTAIHIITQEDIEAGQVNNLALITGTTPDGTPVTDESSDPTPCTTCNTDPTCLDCTNTPLINAVNDIIIDIACDVSGNAGNVLANDTYGVTPVNTSATSQVTFTVLSGNNANITIDNNGNINIVSGIAVGTYTFTYQICSTNSQNTCDQATVTIHILDNAAPTFVEALPADVTVECSAVPTAPTLTAIDSCGTATVTLNTVTNPGNCPGNYTLINTWTATDASGNTVTHVQTITVQDTTAPTFVETLPTDVTVECSAVPTPATLTATDNCGTATVTFAETTAAGTCAGSYILTRTWTATDLCGLTTVHVQTINVQDTTAPTFVETLPTDVTVECSAVPTPATLTATDNCGTATVTFAETTAAGTCAGSYTLTRTWTATDLCGLTTVHVQTITVQDTTAPTFVETLPTDVTVECSAVPTAVTLTATDNCGTATVTFAETTAAGTCAGSYTLTRTWTATDLCGLTTVHVQTINVQDTTAPTFVETLPTDLTVECSAVPTAVTLTATDNCGTATVTFAETTAAGTCAGSYTLTRTWTATDLCGLTTVHVQTITVQDTTAPTFVETLPTDVTVECSAVPTALTLTATDDCGTATVTFAETTAAGTCAGSYTLTRTWTATDLCGLTTVHVQTINVQDTTAPTFVETLPTDVTVECSAVPTAVTLTATDNCGTATVTFAETTAAGTCAGSYTLTRTWTATDLCGLTTVHVQTITVQDTTAPTFVETLPTDLTVECSAVPTAVTLTATDNCGTATVTFAETTAAGTCAGSYTLTRTWTATDLCGLTTVHVQTINVQDTTAPTFVEALPADVTADCGSIPAAQTLTATDSCGTATVTYVETTAAGACPGDSIITRTWTATDVCGNVTSHSQTITVEDNVAPTINTVFDAVLNVTCTTINTAPDLQFTDSCSTIENTTFDEVITNQTASGYTIIRTWTATDECGNVGTASQTVNVTIATPVQTIPSELCIEDLSIDLFSLLDASVETNGTWIDTNNSGALNGSTFTPNQAAVGYYLLSYVIPGGDCPRTIEINMNVNADCVVLPACTINVHNAISPNNDGLNDFFQIDGIECYPNNTVEIYNRWGVLVFDAKGYDNNSKVFRGISEGRVTVKQDSELPSGTYFYILKYSDAEGNNKEKSSYLYINR